MCALENFRKETRDWLEDNCPASMRTRMVTGEDLGGGRKRKSTNPDAYVWLERMAEKGWTAPTWPKEYGGGGLPKDEFLILLHQSPPTTRRHGNHHDWSNAARVRY